MDDVHAVPEGGLLQSRLWADFLLSEGKDIVSISSDTCAFYGSIARLPLVGSYLYVPRLSATDLPRVMRALTEKGRDKGCFWVRVDLVSSEDVAALVQSGFTVRKAPHDMQPRENFVIDLSGSEDALLARMKSKTRYNIRLAQKKGVTVTVVSYSDETFASTLDVFMDLLAATAHRKGVVFHDRMHYEKMFASLPAENIAFYVACYDGETLAVNIATFYGGVATYLHGATSEKYRNMMAPYLLQWRAMQDARLLECTYYDLGGYYSDSQDVGKQGISRFKKSFSPDEKPYISVGSYDVVLSAWRYRFYILLRYIRS